MAIKAKFYVAEVTRYAYNPASAKVILRAVSRGDENKEWASATPMGLLDMTIGNPAAIEQLAEQLGDEVYLTIEPAVSNSPQS